MSKKLEDNQEKSTTSEDQDCPPKKQTNEEDDGAVPQEGLQVESEAAIEDELSVVDPEEDIKLVLDDESSKETITSFDEAKLEDGVKAAISKLGWKAPTPVQSKCLPYSLPGRDVAGFAQTGTGKTGVFLITIANEIVKLKKGNPKHKTPVAIILVPTRELAVQIAADAQPVFEPNDISYLPVYGGVDYEKQAKAISRGVDVIVATPGRLKDYYQKKLFSLKNCLQFVCDEADRMFDMGFIDDIEFFLKHLGEETQKLLFSATTNDQVKELAFEYLEEPEYISVNPEVMTPERIEQHALACESTEKLKVLLGLIREHKPKCSIIFTNTKVVAEWVHYKLVNNGIEADLITGDLPQRRRISLINRIKKGEVKALIATDVASRGLHISDITHVYNFDLPSEAANYVHRIGRTARAGATGSAYSLVCEDYGQYLEAIRAYLGDQIKIDVTLASEALLATEDNAKNPYQDPNFIGTTQATKPKKDERSDRKDRAKSAGVERGRHKDQKRDTNRKHQGKKDTGYEKKRTDRGNQQRSPSQKQKYRKSPVSKQAPQQSPPVVQKKSGFGSFRAMVRKFFSLFFGKKS